jgi:hypothetical protein
MLKSEPESESTAQAEYEPPQIVWEEPFQTTVFGVSCSKMPQDRTCKPGPSHG